MAIKTIETERFKNLLSRVGKASLNALYPKDFEYYAITLELVDSLGSSIDFLTFPINPDSIVYDDRSLTNIIQTAGGVTAIDTGNFIPKMINLSGTFGRGFKLLIGRKRNNLFVGNPNADTNVLTTEGTNEIGASALDNEFSSNLKRGYGVIKVLEKILLQSRGTDDYGKPYELYLYNPALGHNYVVKYMNMKLNQDYKTSNMIWYYNLNLSCISKLRDNKKFFKKKSLKFNLINVAQNAGTKGVRDIRRAIF